MYVDLGGVNFDHFCEHARVLPEQVLRDCCITVRNSPAPLAETVDGGHHGRLWKVRVVT